jgi:hypothetical protein
MERYLDAESVSRVAEFRVDPAMEARLGILAEKANEGTLSGDERAEYEAAINAADLISTLKLKARRQLKSDCS